MPFSTERRRHGADHGLLPRPPLLRLELSHVDAVGHHRDVRVSRHIRQRRRRKMQPGRRDEVGAAEGVAGQPAVKRRQVRRLEHVGAPDRDDQRVHVRQRREKAVAGQVQRVDEVRPQRLAPASPPAARAADSAPCPAPQRRRCNGRWRLLSRQGGRKSPRTQSPAQPSARSSASYGYRARRPGRQPSRENSNRGPNRAYEEAPAVRNNEWADGRRAGEPGTEFQSTYGRVGTAASALSRLARIC